MQDLKIYIVIQDPKTKQDVNITGNFEVFRDFLSGVGTFEIQPALTPSPLKTPAQKPQQSASLREKPKPYRPHKSESA